VPTGSLNTKPLKNTPKLGLISLLVASLVALLWVMDSLTNAGFHADATATLTPRHPALWAVAVCMLVISLTTAVVLICATTPIRHPVLATISAFMLALGVSLLSYNVYWWWAAGSYADTANKQVPSSAWTSGFSAGTGLLTTVAFAGSTALLLRQRHTQTPGQRIN
jgi:hypothetical protein